MKKSQLSGRTIVYILIGLVAITVLSFGILQIMKLSETSQENALLVFSESLQNSLEEQTKKSSGSVKEQTFSVPNDVSSICFVDKNKEIDPFVSNELLTNIKTYEEENVFIDPFSDFIPTKVDWLSLPADENPLCVKPFKGNIDLKIVSQKDSSEIQAKNVEDKKTECVSVLYNGEDKVDVVFLGLGFKSVSSFNDKVLKYIDTFRRIEPFASNIDKINFYRIDDFKELTCDISSYVVCDQYQVMQLASQCPNDYVVVLLDRSKFADFFVPIRSTSVGNIMNINSGDRTTVTMHEFGHSFADLADEYVDEYYEQIRFNGEFYPNCDNTGCPKWSGMNGTECLVGCSTNEFFRPTKTSIMRELSSEFFGPVNSNAIEERLMLYE